MQRPKPCIVYVLSSARDNEFRYVGQTLSRLRYRLTGHLHAARTGRNTPVACWIRREISDGYAIRIAPLVADAVYNETEVIEITRLRAQGCRLLNVTDGGDGFVGYEMTDAHRERIAAKLKGKPKAPEHVEAVALALKGRKPSDAEIEASRKAHAGKPWSEARRAACERTDAAVRSERAIRGRMKISAERRSEISAGAARRYWQQLRSQGLGRGELVRTAKLTDAAVRKILGRLADGEALSVIARSFEVSSGAIAKIRDGKTWTHIEREAAAFRKAGLSEAA